jgi:hypothetical protein
MTIYEGFYLKGFTRIDKGEAGAVFVRYGEPKNISRGGMECVSWHGAAATYAISIPQRPIEGCAIVTRTSKNRYQATVYDERRIEHFTGETLDGLRRTVAEFFEGVAV